MTRSMSVGATVYVVTLTRDPPGCWTARWQQFGKTREACERGTVDDAMSAARLQAQRIESDEGEDPVPETERSP